MTGAPPAPDYKGAAEAQGASSVGAINAQTQANRPDLYTPGGSMTWENNGGHWTGRLQLSPSEQAAYDTQQRIKGNQSSLAEGLQGQASDAVRSPLTMDGLPEVNSGDSARQQAIDATMRQQRRSMDPMWAQREEQMKSELANAGLTPGTQAYDTEMSKFGTQRNQAYQGAEDSAIQSGASAAQQMWGQSMGSRQQGLAERLQRRMQPFNEMQAALSGQQVQMPNMPNFSQAGAWNPTNYLGAASQQGNYGLQANEQGNALAGSVIGAAGHLGGAAMRFSDERLKYEIERWDEVIPGVPLATWRWRGTGEQDVGVIAQDLEKVRPDLVMKFAGLRMVNYAGLVEAMR